MLECPRCTDVECKSEYVFEPDRCLVAALPVMGPVEAWKSGMKGYKSLVLPHLNFVVGKDDISELPRT